MLTEQFRNSKKYKATSPYHTAPDTDSVNYLTDLNFVQTESAKNFFLPENRPIGYRLFAEAANKAGGVISLKHFVKNIFIISDPLIAKELLTTHASKLVRKGIMNNLLRTHIGDSVLTLSGKEWLPLRQAINPSLTDSAVTSYLPSIINSFAKRMDHWLDQSRSKQIAIDQVEIYTTLYYVVSKLLFGVRFDKEDIDKLIEYDFSMFSLWRELAPRIISPPSWVPLTLENRIKRLTVKTDKILQEYLVKFQEHSESRQSNYCILTSVIAGESTKNRCPLRFNHKKPIDLIKTLFYAATFTTALTLEWALRILSTREDLWETIKTEIDTLVADDLSIINAMPNLIKTKAFVLEVARLYSVLPSVFKTASSDINFSLGFIPRGSAVITSIHGIHTNSLYWEDPFAIKLDRFILNGFTPEAYWPFSLGANSCPGRTLALSELVAALALIVRRFNILSQPNLSLEGGCEGQVLKPLYPGNYLFEPRH